MSVRLDPTTQSRASFTADQSKYNSLSKSVNKLNTANHLAKTRTPAASELECALNILDLSYLSEEERNKLSTVVKRDLAVRQHETERLKKCRNSILRRDREAAVTSQSLSESTNCVFCGQKFMLLIQPRLTCLNCGRPVCKRCSETASELGGTLCRLCLKETGYRAMKCNWFYDTVISRFREFGSTTVAKNIFGEKYAQIQNFAEEEFGSILDRPKKPIEQGAVNDNKRQQPQTFEDNKNAHLKKLRDNLKQLMRNTSNEYRSIDEDQTLNSSQKHWKTSKVEVEFRKNAVAQLRSFSQALYIITERDRTMKGTSSRNITKDVINTLEIEVGGIVGRPVKDISDTMSLASDDDLESTAFADRDGVEERLAQILLDKIIEDRSKPVTNGSLSDLATSEYEGVQNGHDPSEVQHITAVEGCPSRMEMKVDFDEQGDFHWLRETPDGRRKPVKLDFHIEHVITGTTDPEGKESFVLSNSGHFGSEAFQSLIKMNQELLRSGRTRGVIIQHQLIIWAARLEDAGRYFAVARHPAGDGMSSLNETEFRLEVMPSPRWPQYATHIPEFVKPMTYSINHHSNYVEFRCTVASNPPPRCLFYRNNTPIPVVIMPLLTSEQDKSDISLSSFSRKFTVISTPEGHGTADMSLGYLRNLILRVNEPSAEDYATYTCRAWNRFGRTETTIKYEGRDTTNPYGPIPSRWVELHMNETRNDMLNTAREIENTAQTHGEIVDHNAKRVDAKPPIPMKSNTTDNSRIQTVRAAEKQSRPVEQNTSYQGEREIVITSPQITKSTPTAKDQQPAQRKYSESPTSPTSSVPASPFVRSASRRSSGPSIVVDRRSQRRRRSSVTSSIGSRPGRI